MELNESEESDEASLIQIVVETIWFSSQMGQSSVET